MGANLKFNFGFSHFIGSPLDTLIPLKNHIFRDWEWFQLQKTFDWFSSVSQLTLSPFAPLKPFSPGAPVDPCTVHKSWKNYLVLPFKLSVTTILYSQKWICLELSFHVLFAVPIILLSFCSFLEQIRLLNRSQDHFSLFSKNGFAEHFWDNFASSFKFWLLIRRHMFSLYVFCWNWIFI